MLNQKKDQPRIKHDHLREDLLSDVFSAGVGLGEALLCFGLAELEHLAAWKYDNYQNIKWENSEKSTRGDLERSWGWRGMKRLCGFGLIIVSR